MTRHTDRWPRGDRRGGRFAPAAGGPAQPVERATKPGRPGAAHSSQGRGTRRHRRASLDELLDQAHALAQRDPGPETDAELAAVFAEIERREGPHSSTDRDRHVDELLDRGYSFTDAYAEAHGLDPAKLNAQERQALVDAERRPGERRARTLRRMYAAHVHRQWLDAEEATRGHLLTAEGRARGIDPITLWSGRVDRARRYASDELKQWWEDHGGRDSYAAWSAPYTGRHAEARAARQTGAGRDYGV